MDKVGVCVLLASDAHLMGGFGLVGDGWSPCTLQKDFPSGHKDVRSHTEVGNDGYLGD